MPRNRKPGAPEPKRRSRNGCWPCKGRKVKCGEEHPVCLNCQRFGETCDYSIRLNWDGRRSKRPTAQEESEGPKVAATAAAVVDTPTVVVPEPTPGALRKSYTFPIVGPSLPRPTSSLISPPQASTPFELVLGKRGKDDVDLQNGTIHVPQAGYLHSSISGPSVPSGLTLTVPPNGTSDTIPESRVLNNTDKPDATAPSITRPRKRTKSLAEAGGITLTRSSSFISTASSLSVVSSPLGSSRILQSCFEPGSAGPLTPALSSAYSDDEYRVTGYLGVPSPSSARSRRPSSQSTSHSRLVFRERKPSFSLPAAYLDNAFDDADTDSCYGYDIGAEDKDLGTNDDSKAVSNATSDIADAMDAPLGFSIATASRFDDIPVLAPVTAPPCKHGYYREPVSIRIPRELEPLPSKLLENSMNLMYFHHFLDHTAQVLLPSDEPLLNPFRTVLPRMAVNNDHLLSLLLAYSASHRARLLQQKEPQIRIALWVEDIFPAVRQALSDTEQIISNTNLATAVMLASLEIISPAAFGFEIPWQRHLALARDLTKKRLADLKQREHPVSRDDDQECAFLWSWFAYLDVIGRLSSGVASLGDNEQNETAEPDLAETFEFFDAMTSVTNHNLDEIDCITGFTTRCLSLLAQAADLARACRTHRAVGRGPGLNAQADSSLGSDSGSTWQTPPATILRAQRLEQEFHASLSFPARSCQHAHVSDLISYESKLAVAAAANEAFHWAGILHLRRHVLGLSRHHVDVQTATHKIGECADRMRTGGYNAETTLLFPLFVAGCDTLDDALRARILDRVSHVEACGLAQVNRARLLMEQVWDTGRPWEQLVSNEFIG